MTLLRWPSAVDGHCGGQTRSVKPASAPPAMKVQDPGTWLGQSRSVVQVT